MRIKVSKLTFAFTSLRVLHPFTCDDVRLLGPCFKTGQLMSLTQVEVQASQIKQYYTASKKQNFVLPHDCAAGLKGWKTPQQLSTLLYT